MQLNVHNVFQNITTENIKNYTPTLRNTL